jgi:hypothetical protein
MEQATGIGGLFFRAPSNCEEPPRLYDPEGHPLNLRARGQAPR